MAVIYEKGTIYLDAEEYWAIKAMYGGYDTSDADVVAGDVRYGVIAYGKDGKIVGSYIPSGLSYWESFN